MRGNHNTILVRIVTGNVVLPAAPVVAEVGQEGNAANGADVLPEDQEKGE